MKMILLLITLLNLQVNNNKNSLKEVVQDHMEFQLLLQDLIIIINQNFFKLIHLVHVQNGKLPHLVKVLNKLKIF